MYTKYYTKILKFIPAKQFESKIVIAQRNVLNVLMKHNVGIDFFILAKCISIC